MSLSNPVEYEKRKAALLAGIAALGGQFSLRKRTSSNLFRYAPRQKRSRSLDLSGFNHVLNLDTANRILDVEGLATFESIADTTLRAGTDRALEVLVERNDAGVASIALADGATDGPYSSSTDTDACLHANILHDRASGSTDAV